MVDKTEKNPLSVELNVQPFITRVQYGDKQFYVMPELQVQYSKLVSIPSYDPGKKDIPNILNFKSPFGWLTAVQQKIGEDVVFALDDALICQNRFLGRNQENLIWAYGPETLRQFNGIVLLGNEVDRSQVEERRGVSFTNFNRTLLDSLVFEQILDMQGITEGLSEYYFTHGESVDGIAVPSQYQIAFENLLQNAVGYYDS